MTIRPTTQPNIISPVACTQEGHRAAAMPLVMRLSCLRLAPPSAASLFSGHRGQMLCGACPHHLGYRGALLLGRRSRRGARPRFGVGTGEGVRARGVAPPREDGCCRVQTITEEGRPPHRRANEASWEFRLSDSGTHVNWNCYLILNVITECVWQFEPFYCVNLRVWLL